MGLFIICEVWISFFTREYFLKLGFREFILTYKNLWDVKQLLPPLGANTVEERGNNGEGGYAENPAVWGRGDTVSEKDFGTFLQTENWHTGDIDYSSSDNRGRLPERDGSVVISSRSPGFSSWSDRLCRVDVGSWWWEAFVLLCIRSVCVAGQRIVPGMDSVGDMLRSLSLTCMTLSPGENRAPSPRRPLGGLWRPSGCDGSSSVSGIFFLFFFFQLCDFLKADLRERSITSIEPATFRCAGRRPATWVRWTGQGCLGYFSVALCEPVKGIIIIIIARSVSTAPTNV